MEQAIRNKLRNVVTQCRKLLEESIAQQLEGQFGIRAGKKDAVQIEDEARMNHLSEEDQREYATQVSNGRGLQRRLFAGDAVQGFAFIDLCRKQFDVVLMNPPFGEFAKDYKGLAREHYPNTYNDIFAAFTERWYWKLAKGGRLGAITSRTGYFITTATDWRTKFILQQGNLVAMADLGEGVMDDAMVEAAAYVFHRKTPCTKTPFFRMLGLTSRGTVLKEAIKAFNVGTPSDRTFTLDIQAFRLLPDSPFAYWVNRHDIQTLSENDKFEPTTASVRQGLVTGDNPRFTRGMWEVPAYTLETRGNFSIDSASTWAPLVMKGPSQPWYSPLTVAVNWRNNGEEIKSFIDSKGRLKSRPQNTQFYFRPGFSWTRRAVRFIPYAIPTGCIPTASRYMAFSKTGAELVALGVTASNTASAFLRFYGEWFCRPNFLVENLKALPWPELSPTLAAKIETLVHREVAARRRAYQNHEPFHDFTAPSLLFPNPDHDALTCDFSSFLGLELEQEIAAAYGFTPTEYQALTRDLREGIAANSAAPSAGESNTEESEDDNELVLSEDERGKYEALVSYCVGVVFGRWDVRMAKDHALIPKLAGPFDPLPVCPPGALVNPGGLPVISGRIVSEAWLKARPDAITLPSAGTVTPETIPDSAYPVPVDWNGLLVVDADHTDGIVRRVREVFEVIFEDRAEIIEKESRATLGVAELRDYFRKPGKGGFWDDHIKRYSKSRRKAPIYWLLQSSKKNYALWLYYHRLDKDMLFKALLNYVEPKIQREVNRLGELRSQKPATGDSSKGAKKLDQEIEKQEDLLAELRDFEGKLRKTANLHLVPDLNDGVILNIAPLHELVPWKEAKKYWEELLDGKYEWSSIGKQLREKGLVE